MVFEGDGAEAARLLNDAVERLTEDPTGDPAVATGMLRELIQHVGRMLDELDLPQKEARDLIARAEALLNNLPLEARRELGVSSRYVPSSN